MIVVALGALSVIASTPADASGVTLDAYVHRVVTSGLAARALEAEVATAEAEVDGAAIWPNPRVEVSRQANAAGVRAGETQDQALVSIPLVLSGRLGLQRESASRGVDAARARFAHARGQLRHEATAAFLDVVAARSRVQAHHASAQVLSELLESIRAREKAGDAAGYDRVRVELEAARLQSALAAAVADEAAALMRARALWPHDGGDLVIAERDLAGPIEAPPTAGSPGGDLERRGDLRALVAERESAQLAADASGRSWIPDPTLSGGGYVLDIIERERGGGYLASIEVPLTLFDHGQRDGARARAQASRAAAQHALLLHRARTELDSARATAATLRERSRRHDTDVLARAHDLMKTTAQAYRAGGMPLLALVDAERVAIEAETVSIEVRLSARRAENDLHLIAGSYDEADDGQRAQERADGSEP